ncbi:MAG: hypothetical protein CMO25_00110 [Thiotrichales bacterium]|jgi:hypothetical protein|nr:hypothetical protein [Gammaproteobacteria bacterium]MBT67790.1 hypothetical protein [Thiotrichales bacterium]HJM09568.1 hypothetical protein [Gammaproteobacteria bacterium]HJN00479.1 hypothetical protein [Gammaproteobacteria bacterium]|tara:strand:+ start:1432 stop:1764 length:333 start_codon:yes stop_codon:yes gene_type:complete
MKRLIVIIGLLLTSCAEMETANTGSTQKQAQLLSFCNDSTVHESGILVAPCPSLETKNRLEKQKEIKMPAYCINFVVDETLVLSDSQFKSLEYKQCKKIVLEKMGDRIEE